MKKFRQILEKPWAAMTLALCSAVLLYMILSNLTAVGNGLKAVWKLISPVVIGIIIAYLMNPLSDFFEFKVFSKIKKKESAHTLAVICTVICLILIIAILLTALIPSLIQSVSNLVSNREVYIGKATNLINKAEAFLAKRGIRVDTSKILSLTDNSSAKITDYLKKNIKPIASVIGDVGASVSNFLVGVLFGVCFLVAETPLKSGLAKARAMFLPKDRLERHNELWKSFNTVFMRYLSCTLLDALIIAAGVFIFLIELGVIVALVNKSGGSAAFGKWAARHIKTRTGAMLATFVLGVLIFIDDYFNCLTVGSVMRPVTDGHKISRAKLSYLIDATAAPVCMIAPISSWAAAVAAYAEDGQGINLFITAIPFNFYSLLTFVFIVALCVMNFDYGAMAMHE